MNLTQRESPRRDTEQRHVLLLAHTRLSLRYVREHYELLAADPRLRFTIAQAPDQMNAGVDEAITELVEASRRNPNTGEIARADIGDAAGRHWDLALFGTYGSRDLLRDDVPCVHIQHGIGAGKLAAGYDFTYGPRWTLYPGGERAGKPLYAVMLEASHAVRSRAVRSCPALADRIRVVGDLPADRLLATDAHRERCRTALGIRPEQQALLLLSTWGPDGLMGTTGEKGLPLLEHAARLGEGYQVMLSMHPHLWFGADGTDPDTWRQRLSGFQETGLLICAPDEPWAPYLAAADVAVIDHGSLSLYYGILQRPSIAVPVRDTVVNPGAPIGALRAASPQLADPAQLRHVVDHAIRTFDPGLMPARENITSYPGQAVERTVAQLYPLMRLPLPDRLPSIEPDIRPTPFHLRIPATAAITPSPSIRDETLVTRPQPPPPPLTTRPPTPGRPPPGR